jgi:hypothetical protein
MIGPVRQDCPPLNICIHQIEKNEGTEFKTMPGIGHPSRDRFHGGDHLGRPV